MASEFIGWQVQLTTKSGSVISGQVSEVNDSDSRLTLTDATIVLRGKSRQVELVSVQGEDIAELKVVSESSTKEMMMMSKVPTNSYTSDPAIVHAKPSTGAMRTQQQPSVPSSPSTAIKNPWAFEDVKEIKKTDFDFQSNLLMFDKKKVFEELKDTLNQDELLVTHNVRPKNIPITSQDSNQTPTILAKTSQSKKQLSKESSSLNVEAENIPKTEPLLLDELESRKQPPVLKVLQKPPSAPLPSRKKDDIEERREELSRLRLTETKNMEMQTIQSEPTFRTIGQLKCSIVPIIGEEQMALIEQRASKICGPTTDQQLESAAREIVRILLGEELTGLPTSVAVLVGDHREGALALAIGRSLANRGIPVIAFIAESSQSIGGGSNDHVTFQRKLFVSSGGKVISTNPSSEHVADVDLVIDGFLGRKAGSSVAQSDFKLLLSKMSSAYVACIERPLIRSSSVFAIAFPKTFHRSLAADIRLFLIDINLPSAAFKQAVPDFDPAAVFGTRMSVRIR